MFLRNLALRWLERNSKLTCPHCKRAASPETFKCGRYLLAQETLTCEQCNETSAVAFWRYHGIFPATNSDNLPLTG